MNEFDIVWNNLQSSLKPGLKIKIWNTYNGYLGDNLTINRVNPDYVAVDPPRVWDEQIIPKKDFELVWVIWQDYRELRLKKEEYRDLTEYFKYIVSILRWYENES